MVIIRETVNGTSYDAFVYGRHDQKFKDFASRLLQAIVRTYPESQVESHQMPVSYFLEDVRKGRIIAENPIMPADYRFRIINDDFSCEIGNIGVAFYWRSLRYWKYMLDFLGSGRPYIRIRANDLKAGEEAKNSLIKSLD